MIERGRPARLTTTVVSGSGGEVVNPVDQLGAGAVNAAWYGSGPTRQAVPRNTSTRPCATTSPRTGYSVNGQASALTSTTSAWSSPATPNQRTTAPGARHGQAELPRITKGRERGLVERPNWHRNCVVHRPDRLHRASSHAGEEGADELRRADDALLGRCVSARGGVVTKKGGGDGISCRSVPRRPSPTSAGVHRGAIRLTACPQDSTDDLAEATLPAHPDLLIPPADLSRG